MAISIAPMLTNAVKAAAAAKAGAAAAGAVSSGVQQAVDLARSGAAAASNAASSTSSDKPWNEWRTTGYSDDLLNALNSQYGKEEWSAVAAFYPNATDPEPLPIDLIINNVQAVFNEHMQVHPALGDYFNTIVFGKAPLSVTVSAVLVDTPDNHGKQALVDAYKNKLRLQAVARTGNIPALRFLNVLISGPVVAMRISENTEMQDACVVTLTIQALSYEVLGGTGGAVVFDYAHGTESAQAAQQASSSPQTEQSTNADPDVGIGKPVPVNANLA